MKKEEEFPPRVTQGADGKYRWTFRVDMLTNLSIFTDVLKVLLISVLITGIIMFLIGACADGLSADTLRFSLSVMLIVGGVFIVILPLGYGLYLLISGRHYVALFTLDEHQIVHRQSKKQAEKGRSIGLAAMVAGLAAGGRGAANAGLMAATRGTTMTTSLASVRTIVAKRRQHLIKVNERWEKNRVYVSDEDFDFVLQFLRDHCPQATVKG